MSSDIALIFITLDDESSTITRGDLRAWVQELGLPPAGLGRESTMNAFHAACEATKVRYVDADGGVRYLVSRRVKKNADFVTYEVVRDDALKVAQIKYFSPRRNPGGRVKGSTRVMSTVRKTLEQAEAAAAAEWLQIAEGEYAKLQDTAPWSTIRRVIRAGMLVTGVPLYRRASTFYTYEDQLDPCLRALEFVQRLNAGALTQVLHVTADTDRWLFARSADHMLAEQARLAGSERIEVWAGADPGKRRNLRASMNMWRKELVSIAEAKTRHEERLGIVLADTAKQLLLAEEMMQALSPNSVLPGLPGD